MQYLYETPNKQYRISKQNDPIWFEVFSIGGEDAPINFYISRYEPSLAEWNVKNPEARLADYIIIQSEETLEECFAWLREHNIISKDEEKFQVEKFLEIEQFLPLTNSE